MMLGRVIILCCLGLVSSTTETVAFFTRSIKTDNGSPFNGTVPHAFVILGASGDLAKREIYPALWQLYRDGQLPAKARIYGFARRRMTVDDLRRASAPFVELQPGEEKLYERFWQLNGYMRSSGNTVRDYDNIDSWLAKSEEDGQGNRIFYLALPPSVFTSTAEQIKRACMAKKGSTRIVIEKPFGRDSKSSQELSDKLSSLFTEEQLYRMDHFLGYEMVQNLIALRFANRLFSASWNKESIASVEVRFEENFGVEGRGGYFDDYGIIRDVMQNHLLQIVSLIAMEPPNSADPDDVRNAKVALLRRTRPIAFDDVLVGQYVGNPDSKDLRERVGYREDPTVPDNSNQSTFALAVLKIENERWKGVPFIIRAGKGLDKNQTNVIIQYKDVANDVYYGKAKRNQLVLRVGKDEKIRVNVMSKRPGLAIDLEDITIDFSYEHEYRNLSIPGAYQRLILDVFRGTQMNFVRSDELSEAWRIFTPMLHEIENKNIQPIEYKFGSTGPKEADVMEKKNNFL